MKNENKFSVGDEVVLTNWHTFTSNNGSEYNLNPKVVVGIPGDVCKVVKVMDDLAVLSLCDGETCFISDNYFRKLTKLERALK